MSSITFYTKKKCQDLDFNLSKVHHEGSSSCGMSVSGGLWAPRQPLTKWDDSPISGADLHPQKRGEASQTYSIVEWLFATHLKKYFLENEIMVVVHRWSC